MDPFEACFGRPPTAAQEAPGRVNLIGEHTDYNGGLVLPCAIPQRTRAAVAPRADEHVRAVSANVEGVHEYLLGDEAPRGRWVDYIQGITQCLALLDQPVRGFDVHVSSDVPIGGGLASSAALEIAVLRALREAFALQLDDVALALLAQRAERRLVGANVGIMDQLASSLGDEHGALLIDTRTLAHRRIPLPTCFELAVIDSGIVHHHASGEYNARRAQCEAAARLLHVELLCELGAADLSRLTALPAPLDKRVRHVLTENARVSDAVAAIEAADGPRLGTILAASHASLRDDYEVSTSELDLLVEIASRQADIFGARMTGGGFGGSIVAVARAGYALAAADRVAAEYTSATGRACAVLLPVG